MSDHSTTTLPVVRAAGDSLALLEQGRQFLAEARAAGEVKQLRDYAAAVERYLRQQKYASEAVQDAAELKLRAERRLGELLAETVRAGNPQLSHDATIGRLPDGVSRSQSHRWQRVAGLPEDVFEAEIAAGRGRGDLSTNALLKLAGREVKRREHEDARRRMAEAAPATDLIHVGDFREVLSHLPDESVDLIFTDPPYLSADLPIYSDLGKFARRVLKPGGSLVCYSPTYNLLAATDQVRPHLTFWTAIVIQHTGPASRLNHLRVVTRCKLLLWFVKGGRYEGDWVTNLILGTRPDKQAHDWQQGEGEASYCIERMMPPGGLVVDPMCGSATTLRAALFLGRRVLGCEIDPDRAKVAATRCDLRAEAATVNPSGWTCWRRAVWLGLTGPHHACGAVPEGVTSCAASYGYEELWVDLEDGDLGFEVGSEDDTPEGEGARPAQPGDEPCQAIHPSRAFPT